MTSPPLLLAKTAYLQFASSTGEELQLEILPGNDSGAAHSDAQDVLATILADDDEQQWFEFFSSGQRIRIPLAEVERAINIAKNDVHGEAWYDRPLN